MSTLSLLNFSLMYIIICYILCICDVKINIFHSHHIVTNIIIMYLKKEFLKITTTTVDDMSTAVGHSYSHASVHVRI